MTHGRTLVRRDERSETRKACDALAAELHADIGVRRTVPFSLERPLFDMWHLCNGAHESQRYALLLSLRDIVEKVKIGS